jgi:predicted NUDIX family phosphoesterase
VTTDGVDTFEDLVAREGVFRDRAAVEQDRGWKQVIPYLANARARLEGA